MHPQIVRNGPGTCPICGMALEPRTISAEEQRNPELTEMSRRLWVSTALTIPLVLLAMGELILGHHVAELVPSRIRTWVELALAMPVCTWAAWPFYTRFTQSLRNRSTNMFTLIGLGVSVAFIYSLCPRSRRDAADANRRRSGGA